MPTIQDLIDKFEQVTNGLRGHVETNVLLTANNGIGLVVERLTETGKNDKGTDFKDYTPQYKLFKAGLTKKKIKAATKRINKKLEADNLGASKSDASLLSKSIGIAGRYKGYVDFQLTGRMLSNIQIVAKETKSGLVKVSIGVTGTDNQDKMDGNIKQRGNFFTFSKKEEKEMTESFNIRLEEFVNNAFK